VPPVINMFCPVKLMQEYFHAPATTIQPMMIGLVPARSGSKGIPGKNLRPLAGVPLIERCIGVALASGVLDRVVVSTDSKEIADLGTAAGAEVPFLRPVELAADDAPMLPVVQHALEALGPDDVEAIVLLQPTAALRQPQDIVDAVGMLRSEDVDSVVTVVEVPEAFNPHWTLSLENGRLTDVVPRGREIARRQDLPKAYIRDGTVYATRAQVIRSGSLYGDVCMGIVVPRERSINLDSVEDWERAERFLSAQ
jgi:CMP-N,N'-diacetyllegionaminic acid synthase